MRKTVKIYPNPDGPYLDALKRGHNETPEQRFKSFFEERKKFRDFMGIKTPIVRKIIIKKVEWI
jgi:hypothetical protein